MRGAQDTEIRLEGEQPKIVESQIDHYLTETLYANARGRRYAASQTLLAASQTRHAEAGARNTVKFSKKQR